MTDELEWQTRRDRIEVRYQKAKAQVDRLTQSILAKAFRGELVRQGQNDEPASVLLERIKAERAGQEVGQKRKRQPRTRHEKTRTSIITAFWSMKNGIDKQSVDGSHLG